MTDDVFNADTYVSKLRAKREEKDGFFGSYPQSLIPSEERDDFDGLDYFDPDPDYRVTAPAETHAGPEPVTMDVSAGGEVRHFRAVTFRFEFRNTDLTLGTYRQGRDDSPTLFVPFRDKTTGQQAYNDGRYMELMPDAPLGELGEIVVDFNFAYNPLCTLTEASECLLPSGENWLGVVAPAGERDYK